MPTVLIQPSIGNAEAKRHWNDTMLNEVDLDRVREAATSDELEHLDGAHPSGSARVWGMTSNHDRQMNTLEPGDVVLFTGEKHVQGVGEVGVVLRNGRVADKLWDPHPTRGSFLNVYTLASFAPTQIPYEEIWDLPSFNMGDNFMGARFLRGEKADELIDGLRITTVDAAVADTEAAVHQLHDAQQAAQVVPDEAINIDLTSYELGARIITVNRLEAQLVRLYRQYLNIPTSRMRTPSGVTDMYIQHPDGGGEVVEAKSSASRDHIRTALGQLLDYCRHIPNLAAMTVLVPARPSPDLVTLLLAVGIAVTFPDEVGAFTRLDPTPDAAARIREALGGLPDPD